MIDTAELHIESGKGGNGAVSFRRERFVPRGGPDGGEGGRGGSVYLRVDDSLNTLLHFQYKRIFKAENGRGGGGRDRHGSDGENMTIAVPPGTRVFRVNGEPVLLVDLMTPGQTWCAASGGTGGRGNVVFASPTNRTPLLAEAGEPAKAVHLRLELLLLADVAIIGQPNAGKSTLLGTISKARPDVAPYPFTTLDPVLGLVEVGQTRFVVVEIPGLIQGSHEGRGLGDQFLRHAQRSRLFLHLVDSSQADPVGAYEMVREEVSLFDPEMAQRPEVVAATKTDLPSSEESLRHLRRHLGRKGVPVYPISALSGEGVETLVARLAELLGRMGRPAVASSPGPQATEEAQGPRYRVREVPQVSRAGDGAFVVQSHQGGRLVQGTDLRPWRARVQLWEELRRLGVVRALERAGAGSGSRVRFDDKELEWP